MTYLRLKISPNFRPIIFFSTLRQCLLDRLRLSYLFISFMNIRSLFSIGTEILFAQAVYFFLFFFLCELSLNVFLYMQAKFPRSLDFFCVVIDCATQTSGARNRASAGTLSLYTPVPIRSSEPPALGEWTRRCPKWPRYSAGTTTTGKKARRHVLTRPNCVSGRTSLSSAVDGAARHACAFEPDQKPRQQLRATV